MGKQSFRDYSFDEIKEAYVTKREEERLALSNFFKEEGLQVVTGTRAGKGSKCYGKNRYNPPYDLRNWKWVEVIFDDKIVLISLNPYDIDPSTGNIHVLYDRIGIYIKYNDNTICNHKCEIITKYELPLKDDERKEIYNMITNVNLEPANKTNNERP